ncbi:ABC transporter ATP-binding protein [Effusibacillus lacus]|uniref:ABC transporter ATP-binding protein n=1 Tax=Effusibacillus lacus TaxID=1348429 RepID=A0A292YK94_9BACL|nr:ABC transporter ATP-binding protein [Effusibacillus lacus]TCS71847.1 ABC-type multidrug transport system ATPase subunit [Effusibacillus lacus]GAX89586.1 ABC transporter ATP-binding protein [Effusibacillus lacus]
MVKTVLELDNVSKTIGEKIIVQPFSLRLSAGQVLALCGGNGAGKSTILRMIAGILQPSSGTIRVCGLEWKHSRKEFAGKIGYMPDDFQFGQSLTARETLGFFAELRGVSRDKADQTLELVGLSEVANRQVSGFSKGMRQRLLFAQALLADPPLLILDEPTNGLDPYWMRSFVSLLNTVKKAGQSVIFSTHNLGIAEETADQAVFLREGCIVSSGPIEQYRNQYGAMGLIGAFSESAKPDLRQRET